ncbi:Tricalbin-2 [Mycoemilia scoparia]|uniref:Tricalbin-2 n=1 Tax=Mycoemilia scoparia TaxID=417184 RepID=A0A9W8A1M0_9FUNG|nr:Tricalbin-2 [Mycoemilia scoparia]
MPSQKEESTRSPPPMGPLPPTPDQQEPVAVKAPESGQGSAVAVHKFDPDETPEQKAAKALKNSMAAQSMASNIPDSDSSEQLPKSDEKPSVKKWPMPNGGELGKAIRPSDSFSSAVQQLMNVRKRARQMRYKTSKETGIVKLPARPSANAHLPPPSAHPDGSKNGRSSISSDKPSDGDIKEKKQGEEAAAGSAEPKGIFGWKEAGAVNSGQKESTLSGIWAMIDQLDRTTLWRNCAGFFTLMFFMYIVTRLGFGFFGFLVVTSFGAQWYKNSIIRFRRACRDDTKRSLEASQLVKSMESAGWMNEFLSRFWLIYEPVLSATVVQIADTILDQQAPGFIDSLRLTEFTLGTKAPRIEGIKTYSEIQEDDIIVMDWEASFTPNDIQDVPLRLLADKVNPKIVLTVRVGKGFVGAGLPIMVEDMVFRGKMQIRLHLMKSFPHIKSADVCFIQKPKIDFVLKPVGGDTFGMDIAHVPVLQKFILDLVHSNLAPMFYAPNHFTIDIDQLLNGTVSQIDSAIGILVVTFHYARGLPKVDTFGSADPYVRAYVSTKPEQEVKTSIKEDTLNPTWDETKVILVYKPTENLQLDVFDWNNVGKDEQLGSISIPIKDFEEEPEQEGINKTITHGTKENGRLNFDASYFPVVGKAAFAVSENSNEEEVPTDQDAQLAPTEVESNTGLLQLYVRSARNLAMSKAAARKLHTHCKAFLNKELVIECPEVKKTDEPVWEKGREVFIADKDQSKLVFKVMDGDRKIGVVRVDLNTAIERQSKQDGQDWYPIEGHFKGQLRIYVLWRPILMDADMASQLGQAKKLKPPPIGIVKLNMWEARNVKNVESLQGSKSDPYVRVMIQNNMVTATRWIANNLSPVWNETLFVPVHRVNQTIVLECMDYNAHERHKPLGEVVFHVQQLLGSVITMDDGEKAYEKGKPLEMWAGLKQRNGKIKGELRFRATFIPVINFDDDLLDEDTRQITPSKVEDHLIHLDRKIVDDVGKKGDEDALNVTSVNGEPESDARKPNGKEKTPNLKVNTTAANNGVHFSGTDSSVPNTSSLSSSSSMPLKPNAQPHNMVEDSIFSGLSGQTQNTAVLRRYPRLPNINYSEFQSGVLTFYLLGCHGLGQSYSGVYAVVTSNIDAQESIITTEVSGRRGTEHSWEEDVGQISALEAQYNKIKIEVFKKEIGGSGNRGYIARWEGTVLELLQNKWVNTPTPVCLPLEDGLGEVVSMFRWDPVEDPELTPEESITDQGELRVRLISGRNMPAVDRSGTSDPFVVLQVNGEPVWKSDVHKETLNPQWNQQVVLYVRERGSTVLTADVFDWNKIQSSERLGAVDIPLNTLPIEKPVEKDYYLDARGQASIRVQFMFVPTFVQQHDDSKPVLSSLAHSFTSAPVTVVKGGTKLAGTVIGGGFHVASDAVGGLLGMIRGKDRKKSKNEDPKGTLSPAASAGLEKATNLPGEDLKLSKKQSSPSLKQNDSPNKPFPKSQDQPSRPPNNLSVPTSTFHVPASGVLDSFPVPGTLLINLIEAELSGDKTSSYVSVAISGKTAYETKAKKENHPRWDEVFKLPTLSGFKPTLSLSIKHSRIGRDKVLFNTDLDPLSLIQKELIESQGMHGQSGNIWLEDKGNRLCISVEFDASGTAESPNAWDQKSAASSNSIGKKSTRRRVSSIASKLAPGHHNN